MDCDIDATQVLDLGLDTALDRTEVEKKEVGTLKTVPHKLLTWENEFPIYDGPNIIGRDDRSDVTIKLQCISKKHACIEVENGAFLVYDLDSRNKSRKGQMLLKPYVRYELNDGDKLTFGDLQCEFTVTPSEDLDETKSLSGSETGSESLIPEDEEELFQLDADLNSLVNSNRISSVVENDLQNDSTMSEGFILPTQYQEEGKDEEDYLNESNLSDFIINPTQHVSNDRMTCQETPKSEKICTGDDEERGIYAMDSDQEDSEEKRYTPDAIGETPGAGLRERRSTVFESPLVINDSKNDESIPSPLTFDANSSKAKKGLMKFRNSSNFVANVVFRSPPCTLTPTDKVDGQESSEEDEPPATFVFDAGDFNNDDDDDDDDDDIINEDKEEDRNENKEEPPATFVFDAGDFDDKVEAGTASDREEDLEEEIKTGKKEDREDDDETDVETDIEADVDANGFEIIKTTLDDDNLVEHGDTEEDDQTEGVQRNDRTFTMDVSGQETQVYENGFDTNKIMFDGRDYGDRFETEKEEEIQANNKTYDKETNEATQAYENVVSGEATQAYENDIALQATQAYDNDLAAQATQAYDNDLAAQATQAYDNDLAGQATQAYENDVAGQATQAYENDLAGQATQAYEDDFAGQATQAYGNNVCGEATQAYESDVPDEEATQAYVSTINGDDDDGVEDTNPTQPYQFSDSEDDEATQPYQSTSPMRKSPAKKGLRNVPALPTLPGGSSTSKILHSEVEDTHYNAVDASTGMNSDNDQSSAGRDNVENINVNDADNSAYDDIATQQYVQPTTSSTFPYEEVSTQLYTLDDDTMDEEKMRKMIEKKKKRKSVRFSVDITDRKKYPARRSKGKRYSDESENDDLQLPAIEITRDENVDNEDTPPLPYAEIEPQQPEKRKGRGGRADKKTAPVKKSKSRAALKALPAEIDENIIAVDLSYKEQNEKEIEPDVPEDFEEETIQVSKKSKKAKKPTLAEIKRQKAEAKIAEKLVTENNEEPSSSAKDLEPNDNENLDAENEIDMNVGSSNDKEGGNEKLDVEPKSSVVVEEEEEAVPEIVTKKPVRTKKGKKSTKAELKKKREEEKKIEMDIENKGKRGKRTEQIQVVEEEEEPTKIEEEIKSNKSDIIEVHADEEGSIISSSRSRRGQQRTTTKTQSAKSRTKCKTDEIENSEEVVEEKIGVDTKPSRSKRSRNNTNTELEKIEKEKNECKESESFIKEIKDNVFKEKVKVRLSLPDPDYVNENVEESNETTAKNNRKIPVRNRKERATAKRKNSKMEVDENIESSEGDFTETKKVTGRKNTSKRSNKKAPKKEDYEIDTKDSVIEKDNEVETINVSTNDGLNVVSIDEQPLPEEKKTGRSSKASTTNKAKKVTSKRALKSSVTTGDKDAVETEKENEIPSNDEKLGTPRRSIVMKPKVIFTGMNDKSMEKIVTDLGGEIVDNILAATHLVTDKVRRTVKFMCAVGRGIHIVHPEWLIASKASKTFAACQRHILKDETAERQYKFQLQPSLEKAKDNPLFADKKLYVTKNVKPERAYLKEMIESAGGTYLARIPRGPSDDVIVVSCAEDEKEYTKLVSKGFTTCTKEIVLSGLLRHLVDTELFSINNLDDLNCSQLSMISEASTLASSKRKVLEAKDSPSKRKRRK